LVEAVDVVAEHEQPPVRERHGNTADDFWHVAVAVAPDRPDLGPVRLSVRRQLGGAGQHVAGYAAAVRCEQRAIADAMRVLGQPSVQPHCGVSAQAA
jgi:hypothetical protein